MLKWMIIIIFLAFIYWIIKFIFWLWGIILSVLIHHVYYNLKNHYGLTIDFIKENKD